MIKIVILSIVCGFVVIYLRHINSELSSICLLLSEIIVILCSLNYIENTFNILNKLSEISNIDSEFIKIILKITSIGFIVEFGAGMINDLGLNSLSDKLIIVGKIIIISISLPIIYSLIELFLAFLK